ncbi:MAG: hypothetical protein ABJ327_22220 [Litoreibacter sp.]
MKFCSIALLCIICAQSAFAENTAVVGTFDGMIWSSGDAPGTTQFFLTSDDEITAAYIYDSLGETAEGRLENCALTAQILRCIWKDEWGSGGVWSLLPLIFQASRASGLMTLVRRTEVLKIPRGTFGQEKNDSLIIAPACYPSR